MLGTAEYNAALVKLGAEADIVIMRELYTWGGKIMGVSQDKYVPVDYGTLKGSGYVKEPVNNGGEIVVEMGYGGAAQAYALKQHEDVTLHHPPLNPRKGGGSQVGGPKFLERPANEMAPQVRDGLEAALDGAIGRL